MKRIISLMLILVLAAALVVSPVIAANGDGSGNGDGTGGGNRPLTVVGVTVDGNTLEGAEVAASGVINVEFSNGMTENEEANKAAITITGAESVTVTMLDKHNFSVEYRDLTEGAHELVIAKNAQANNGNTLDADVKVSFRVKAEEDPHAETCPSRGFTDVNRDVENWTHLPIDYALSKQYMTGESSNKFNPDGNVLRATVVQVLYAKEGKPAVEKKAGFTDVKDGDWYADAVSWAAAQGIVSGYDAKTFGPKDPVTREQLALMFMKYAQRKELKNSTSGDLSRFKDQAQISKWAVEGVQWAVGAGIIAGTEKGTIEPQARARRAELAVIMKAFDEKVEAGSAEPEEATEPETSVQPEPSEAPAETETSADADSAA